VVVLVVLWILTAIGMFGTVVPSTLLAYVTVTIVGPTVSLYEQVLNELKNILGPVEILLILFAAGFVICTHSSRARRTKHTKKPLSSTM
jgi:integral membrane sensor domain MASE1